MMVGCGGDGSCGGGGGGRRWCFFFVCFYLFIYFIKGGNGAACRIGVQDNENTKPWKKKKQNRTISVLGVGL